MPANFRALLVFELTNRLRRKVVFVYFLVYLVLAFMMSISFAGAFRGVSVGFGLSAKLPLNSPVVINYFVGLLGYLGMLVVAPIFGQSISQDFENGFGQILFATPIGRQSYFLARYLASFVVCALVLSAIGWGIYLATFMPFIDRTLVGEGQLSYYLMPYAVNLLPNILIFGALFIGIAARYQRMAPVYFANIGVFTGWLIASNLTDELSNRRLSALIDPFGLDASSQIVRYWSVVEQSTRLVTLAGPLLENRLLWGAIGLLCLVWTTWRFDPSRLPQDGARSRVLEEVSSPAVDLVTLGAGPEFTPSSVRVLWGLAVSEFKQAFQNVYFLMILACGMLYILAVSPQVSKLYGTETWPVTYLVLEVLGGQFGLFMILVIGLYSGELVWKDREQRMDELIDSKPVSNLYLYLSKLGCLALLQVGMMALVGACCVLVQVFKGYYHFEWVVYFKHLVVYGLPSPFLACVLALFIQTLAPNRSVGKAAIVFYYVLLLWLPSLGLNHHLYLIGSLPRDEYSDMNGFGSSFYAFATLGLYWGFFHLGLGILTVLLWRRGVNLTWRERIAEAKARWRPSHRLGLTAATFSWVALGAFIFYNTNILNEYRRPSADEQDRVDYEKTYQRFASIPQPQVVGVNVQMDIFPKGPAMASKVIFRYRNITRLPENSIFLNVPNQRFVTIEAMEFNRKAELVLDDSRLGVRRYDFAQPLLPGEELELHYGVAVRPRGFGNGEFSHLVVENGTFIHNEDYFPVVGYLKSHEIEANKTRRKYGLTFRPRMSAVDDTSELAHTYLSSEGNWIDFEATVSTSLDQTAIAPGYLVKTWIERDRRYFHYKMDQPILDFYAFQSARYEVTRDKWHDVNIEIYHHPSHTMDLASMINAVKKSLDYYTRNFAPYQFKQVRIIEFPRYERFAQAFPNTIPYSEAIGFIARVRPNQPDDIDYPLYVTAHEMAHQWWGHQLAGANVQGATLLSESLAQYSALMVQEHEFGPAKMRKFLKYELDRYLEGRSHEELRELPLDLNEDQGYIHYRKGSLVFYALKDYLGEDVVNRVLHDYLKEHAFKPAPFTRGVDLVAAFKAAVRPEQLPLIEDLLETITTYDNRTDQVTYHKAASGKGYEVAIRGSVKKIRTDDQGKDHEVAMDDLVDIGVVDRDGLPLSMVKVRMKSGALDYKVHVDGEPAKGGIDPFNKLIDRVPEDNLIGATVEK